MKLTVACVGFLFASALCPAAVLRAQTAVAMPAPAGYSNTLPSAVNPYPRPQTALAPFSRFALGVGVSAMGVNMQAAVNANRYLNVRAVGNYFNYSRSNMSFNGFTATGAASFATGGASLDYFPWPNHGFRISPGVLVCNKSEVGATMVVTGGTSFTLNDTTFYSSPLIPLEAVGGVNLHVQNPAPSLTVGWGNLIPRNGGHWSFPIEVGAAYIGAPAPNIAFIGGEVCANAQGTVGCQAVVGDTTLNADLQAQLVKYKNDLQPLRFYPLVSFGVGFSFPIRGESAVYRRQ